MNECTLDRFRELAMAASPTRLGSARRVPVWRETTCDVDSAALFTRIDSGASGFLLESATAGQDSWSRHTIIGTEPFKAWRFRDGQSALWQPGVGWSDPAACADPFSELESVIAEYGVVDAPELTPFSGGAIGYFGYDMVRCIERLPDRPPGWEGVPDACFIIPRCLVVFDKTEGATWIVVAAEIEEISETALATAYEGALDQIAAIEDRFGSAVETEPSIGEASRPPASGLSSTSRREFCAAVDRIKKYIAAGDCFQALLARSIELEADFDPGALYVALRSLNPSPYMYHLRLDGIEIVGSSPELLVRLSDDRVTVRPIAGTRPRGSTPEEDDRLSRELLADPKERAEHVMLVDLGRNDVGRVARYGSVSVTELMKIEKYSHVLHIVSEVRGEVAQGRTAMDVLRATFPAGTMTGAPKVRAMEIIDELEPVSRGPYAGGIGYISSNSRSMELAITIRSCMIAGGKAFVQAGAGIVADSVAENEWIETENKALAVLTAIGRIRSQA